MTQARTTTDQPMTERPTFRTAKGPTDRLPWWPQGTGVRTASDQEVCQDKARTMGLCGALMAHGRCCIEEQGQCPKHRVTNQRLTCRTIRLYDPANNPTDEPGQWLAASEDKDGRPVSGQDRTPNGAVVECLIRAGVLGAN